MQSLSARARTAGTAQTSRPALAHRSLAVRAQAAKKDSITTPTERVGHGVLYTLALNAPSLAIGQALADEAAAPATGAAKQLEILGLPAGTVAILLAPVFLYTIFTIYRTSFNPNVKISDFLFFLGATAVFGNIFAILVLKIRFF